ncbi:MAG: hypothetical protein IMF06_05460 [Proteobacteria bacterium]|nr:hypothetical protein [Pseudomonadota bacterium]
MNRVTFKTKIHSKELDAAFKLAQKEVEKAANAGSMGAVFCQISKNQYGTYNISGAFYPANKAKIINDALIETNKSA